jgi:gliding motility-associated-like protein
LKIQGQYIIRLINKPWLNDELIHRLKRRCQSFIVFGLIAFVVKAQIPVVNFTASPTSGCSPLFVNFQDQSSNNPTSWFWDFGNGATSTVQNPTVTFLSPGLYTVKLTATNASGSNTLTRTNFINVYESPFVNFAADDTVGCFPQPVQFTDLSTAGTGNVNTTWEWNFGDGAVSNQQNPKHTYTISGNFTSTLRVTNDKGCYKIFSKPQYIQVSTGVIASFTNNLPAFCSPPADISFNNTSSGPGILTYQWNFGDGNISAVQNPVHTYSNPGSYTLKLSVTSSLGCSDSVVKFGAVQLSAKSASFIIPDSTCINAAVNINNTSFPVPNSQNWDFGDGTNSALRYPVKTYSTPGIYKVTLTNNYSGCMDTAIKTIVVSPRPAANFTAPVTINCQIPLTVNFQNTSNGAISWLWDFGDGNTSTQQNPVHTYSNYGNFNVKLIATNNAGCTDTMTKTNFVRIARAAISISGFPKQGCIPYTINPVPNITSLDAVTSYAWDFGDGGTSTLQKPSHTYTALGTYTIRLIITTSLGCSDTLILKNAVKVGTPPTVDFTASPLTACAFTDVQFTDLSVPADDWLWDFGDGTTSTLKNPIHQFSTPSPAPFTYTVKLTAKNSGCPVTAIKTSFITILPPVAGFLAVPNCASRTQFTITDISTGATSWSWDFGDGTTSTLQNPPPHNFPTLGVYTVKLTVTNGSCTHSASQTIRTINENPDFTSDITTLCKKQTVKFIATGIQPGNISKYQWNFGDGNQIITDSTTVSHTYITAGNYTVRLVTFDLNNCTDTIIKTNYIRTNGPVANFSASNTDGCKGLTATFNDLTTTDGVNPLVSWQWNFGDGNIQTFTLPPFTHTYNNTGTFSVILRVTDAAGCADTVMKNNLVHSTDPEITFLTYNTLTCPGSVINWGVSGMNYNSLFWDFGDGTTSTQTFPPKSYATPGIYTVKIFVSDQYGCADSLVRSDYIRVDQPTAAFAVDDSVSVCAPFEVNFTNTSSYYNSQLWTFEPGITSAIKNPAHYFSSSGNYNVKLVVTSPGGCQDSVYKTIRLYDTTGSQINYNPFAGCQPLNITLNAVSNGISTFIWDFGDGQTVVSNSPNITHTYTEFGKYTPNVIMQDPTGCLIPLNGTDTIQVKGAIVNFGLNKNFLCDGGFVSFLDSTVSNDLISSYNWSFGDGGVSAQHNPSHIYNGAGYYNVMLAVTTQNGCTDTLILNNALKIVASPQVRIDGDNAVCASSPARFTGNFIIPDSSTVTWNWNFGNGATSVQQNPPPQIFSVSGNYFPAVIATNSSGCKDTAMYNIRIHPLPIVTMPADITTVAGVPVTIPAVYSGNMISYNWTPAIFLSCTDCPKPVATPGYTQQYSVSFTDSNSCNNTGTILVKAQCKNANVFIPNTFSPNNDGSNDMFYPRGTGLDRAKVMRIFNRWGEVVYERYDFPVNIASYGWDGTMKGKKANNDVYVYQVEVYCMTGEVLTLRGNIALIR